MCTRFAQAASKKHFHCLNVVGRRWTQSISKMLSRSGSEFYKVVLTSSRAVSATLPEWHCKNGKMLLSQAIIRGRSARGKRSRCFPSCCCDALRNLGKGELCARFDKFGVASGQNSWRRHKIQLRSHNRIPHNGKRKWEKCHVHASASQVQH